MPVTKEDLDLAERIKFLSEDSRIMADKIDTQQAQIRHLHEQNSLKMQAWRQMKEQRDRLYQRNRDLHKGIILVRDGITIFDKQCEEAKRTDTGEVWELLNLWRTTLDEALGFKADIWPEGDIDEDSR